MNTHIIVTLIEPFLTWCHVYAIYLSPTYLRTYLPILSIYLPTYIYLPIYLPIFISISIIIFPKNQVQTSWHFILQHCGAHVLKTSSTFFVITVPCSPSGNLTLTQHHCLTYSQYFNFLNCPPNVLLFWEAGSNQRSRMAFSSPFDSVSRNLEQFPSLFLSFTTLVFEKHKPFVLYKVCRFGFVWLFLVIRLGLNISGKNDVGNVVSFSVCPIKRHMVSFVLLLVMLTLITWPRWYCLISPLKRNLSPS